MRIFRMIIIAVCIFSFLIGWLLGFRYGKSMAFSINVQIEFSFHLIKHECIFSVQLIKNCPRNNAYSKLNLIVLSLAVVMWHLAISIPRLLCIDSGSRCITISRILLSSPCFDFLRSEDHAEGLCLSLIVESSRVRLWSDWDCTTKRRDLIMNC